MAKGPNEVGGACLSEKAKKAAKQVEKMIDYVLDAEPPGKNLYFLRLKGISFKVLNSKKGKRYLRDKYLKAGWQKIEFDLSIRSEPIITLVDLIA